MKLIDKIRAMGDDALAVCREDPDLRQWLAGVMGDSNWYNFRPRPDAIERFDQQSSFVYNRDNVAFSIGGNAAGTTTCAAYKLAEFVLRQQPPPRKDTPFWIISNTYEQCCGVVWAEKLLGKDFIPECEIEWDRIRWMNKSDGYPFSVPLLPWPGKPGKNWRLEFKSYEQGRRALQARSIGGFMFSEQFPLSLFIEVLRGCREYMFPGGQFCEFTPIEPELCLWLEKVMEEPPEGWKFYRMNTELNTTLADGWLEQFKSVIPDEMLATRMTGALASFEGVIYAGFNAGIHCVSISDFAFPDGAEHFRGIDWGFSEEHAFAVVFGYIDGLGDWWIYNVYWSVDQVITIGDHANRVIAESIKWGWPDPTSPAEIDEANAAAEAGHGPVFGLSFGDPSRPDKINEFTSVGIVTHPAMNNVSAGIDTVRSYLKIHPKRGVPRIHFAKEHCGRLIEELRKYRWRKGRKPTEGQVLNPKVAAPEPLKRDDDCCDALRYLLYSVAKTRGADISSAEYRPWLEKKGIQIQRKISQVTGEYADRKGFFKKG